MLRIIAIAILTVGLLVPVSSNAQDFDALFYEFDARDLTQADKRFLQTALAFSGDYNGLLDGAWGQISQRAFERYAAREFGAGAEDWQMAVLAFDFLQTVEQDGWAIRYLDGLDMSLLYPWSAVRNEASTDYFVNWRHTNSSLGISTGIHSLETVRRVHEFTASTHAGNAELYTLRRPNFAITSATQGDGGILYARSNYINGTWRTVMLSANPGDVPILNAVAASITVGRAAPISISPNGKLEAVILKAVAFVENGDQVPLSPQPAPPVSQSPGTTAKTGTGFVVSEGGKVLTNAHVVERCMTITFNGVPATVSATSPDFDLALIQATDWQGTAVASFAPSPAKLNSDVTVVGYPLTNYLSGLNVTRGAVSSMLGYGGDIGGMQITAPVQPGNSGGPVLGSDGDVVGVVVSKLDAQTVADETGDIPQNINFAIRGELAKLFLFQNGVDARLGLSDDPLPPETLAEQAASFTGLIECR
jgi:serine protease Do